MTPEHHPGPALTGEKGMAFLLAHHYSETDETQGRAQPGRLCHYLGFEISLRKCHAPGEKERGLGEQYLAEAELELATAAEELQGVVQ